MTILDHRYFERAGAMAKGGGRAAATGGGSSMASRLGGGLDKKARQAKYNKGKP
jgi:hypothetical protein